uniref:Cell wall integrity and stress response component 4-like isoform X2 n=1 Tax=Crassostrea virginica TaxID=6565 RepID=A0A8B8BF55_CRAVI|nr:cell wall integrity and stress response component 4-like isoform X2 [Crassostrea virginica]
MLFLFALFNILTLICCKKDVFLYDICVNEDCNWYQNSRFGGCIDKHVLRFSYFDTTSSIDLTCASVQQIFIQSEFDCNDVPSIIENAKNVPIVFVGDAETRCEISSSLPITTTTRESSSPSVKEISSSLPITTTRESSSTSVKEISSSLPITTTRESSSPSVKPPLTTDTTPNATMDTSSTVTILIIISLCLSAATFCGCLCWLLVQRFIRKRIQQDHIENIESVLSNYSIADSDESSL